MNLKHLKLASAFLIAFSGSAFAGECALPQGPIIADGNVASEDELVASQTSVKEYQAELGTYRECLKNSELALDLENPEVETLKQAILDKYNASVDEETAIVEEFSAAVAAFRARQ